MRTQARTNGETFDADAFNAFEAAAWEEGADAYHGFFGPLTARVIEQLLDAANVDRGSRVLDVASGPGYVAAACAVRGADVVGVDVAAKMVSLARMLRPEIDFRQGDAERLPFADGSFDAVLGNFLILHVGRPEQVAVELARVLRPGGKLALSTWDLPEHARLLGVLADAVAEAGAQPPAHLPSGPPLFRFADEGEFTRLLGDAGLSDIDVQTLAFTHRFTSGDELWDGLIGGTVRTRALVLAQPDDVQARIRAAFDRLVRPYATKDGLEIPVSVKLASGRRGPHENRREPGQRRTRGGSPLAAERRVAGARTSGGRCLRHHRRGRAGGRGATDGHPRASCRRAQQREMRETYLSDIDFPAGARVLEVGCGPGPVARALASRPGVGEVVGVDPSPIFLAKGRALARHLPNLTFVEGDARALPLEDGSFDVVVFHTTLCHVPAPELALAETRRVLRTGGSLGIFDGDYATATCARDAFDPLQACADACVDYLVYDRWLVRRLPRLVREAGFELLRFRGYSYVEAPSSDGYMLSIADRGAEALLENGRIGLDLADALKAEARRRSEAGEFFGHIAYASLIARRAQ